MTSQTTAAPGPRPGARYSRARRRGHRRGGPGGHCARVRAGAGTPRRWPTRTSCRSLLPATCWRPRRHAGGPAGTRRRRGSASPRSACTTCASSPTSGSPDDAAGTVIEDRGVAASPRGRRGGGAPGTVGNFIVTGHRTAAGAPLGRLPELLAGAHVLVLVRFAVHDYVVTGTMSVSFRSPASLALQTAAEPGHPGQLATRPMVTLSTWRHPRTMRPATGGTTRSATRSTGSTRWASSSTSSRCDPRNVRRSNYRFRGVRSHSMTARRHRAGGSSSSRRDTR